MLILMTGVPGAGKTLSTIKFVCEDEQFQNRKVFYHNIRDCNIEGWEEITTEQAHSWYDLPKGSVIIFDECQEIFPVAGPRKSAPPQHIEELARHRHYGFDIILITQEPRNINAFTRRLINIHRHHERIFGTSNQKVFEWHNKCQEDVTDHFARRDAEVTHRRLDKKYFGAYHSAEIHTHKSRFPWRKVAIFGAVVTLLVGYGGYNAYAFITRDRPGETQQTQQVQTQSLSHDIGTLQSAPEGWYSRQIPRIDGLPHTAPMYDELTKPKTYPRLVCGLMEKVRDCRCITQQGTKVSISYDMCVRIVRRGLFDPARPDSDTKAGGEGGSGPAARPASQPDPHAALNKVHF